MDTSSPFAKDIGSGIMRGLSKIIFAAILLLETVAIPKLSATGFNQEKNIVYGHKHGLGLLMDVFSPE